jgi:hypothetical protein
VGRCLWRVLALVSSRGSIRYAVRRGVHREDLIRRPPSSLRARTRDDEGWWLPVTPP